MIYRWKNFLSLYLFDLIDAGLSHWNAFDKERWENFYKPWDFGH